MVKVAAHFLKVETVKMPTLWKTLIPVTCERYAVVGTKFTLSLGKGDNPVSLVFAASNTKKHASTTTGSRRGFHQSISTVCQIMCYSSGYFNPTTSSGFAVSTHKSDGATSLQICVPTHNIYRPTRTFAKTSTGTTPSSKLFCC